jgi:universal stress protein E
MATALDKAALIEHYTGAEIEVAQIVWDPIEDESIPDHTKATLISALMSAERNALRNLVAPYRDRIAWSEERLLWSKRPAAAIEEEVRRDHIDLVVKPVGEHHSFADLLVTPLDWKVLRSLACPVLISKSPTWQTGGNILAAVNILDTDHQELTAQVLAKASTLSALLDAKLHIVTAHSDLQPAEGYFEDASEYDEIRAELAANRTNALHTLVSDLSIVPQELHVRAGNPATVINELANDLNATVTVIGTSARRGLAKLVLGNTAETVLNKLSCDILTVRVID